MECIICKDAGDEPLHDNTSCKCKYKYHNSCWVDYVNSKETLQCLMCRTKIGTTTKTRSRLFNPPPPSAPPVQPYVAQTLTFQEFREVLGLPRNPDTQTTHNTTTPLIPPRSQSSLQPQQQQQTNRRKPFTEMTSAEKGKFVLGAICIVAVIVIVIVIVTSVL